MNAFSKKPLIIALGAAAAMATGAASAVNLSQEGLGQVLIFPYYTVNAAAGGKQFNTLLNIVNTSQSVKAVKVRFREALASQEVLDFNVFLSVNDMWTASITPTADGGGQIATNDTSCTIPAFTANVPVAFRSSAYAGDGGGNGITRTAEGYVEVFDMASYPASTTTAKAATHDQTKGKPSCALTNATATADADWIIGGLSGSMAIVNPQAGGAFSIAPTVLDNLINGGDNYQDTGSNSPNYNDGDAFSWIIRGGGAYYTEWNTGIDAVTSVLMADTVINEYALDPTAGPAATNWIITHPTKYFYTYGLKTALPPFTTAWDTKTGKACEAVSITEWNREEASNKSDDFSPAQGGAALCWEVNSLGFSTVNIFGSKTFVSVNTPFANGWAAASFGTNNHISPTFAANFSIGVWGANAGTTFYGLPVIGFAAEAFTVPNLVINGVNTYVSFGNLLPHKYGQFNIQYK